MPTFKSLKIGQFFEFDHTGYDFAPPSFFCQKISARRYLYQHGDDWWPCQIGDINLPIIFMPVCPTQ